jgi:hypothetical protein
MSHKSHVVDVAVDSEQDWYRSRSTGHPKGAMCLLIVVDLLQHQVPPAARDDGVQAPRMTRGTTRGHPVRYAKCRPAGDV